MPQSGVARRASAVLALAACLSVTACSHTPKPAGPDVTGLNLQDAEAKLKHADVGYTTHASDAMFGVLIPQNFVVCSEHYVAKHMVRLEVAKHGC